MRYTWLLLLLMISTAGFAQEEASDFSFEYLDGQTSTLTALDNEVVYISFWASWCGPCIKNFKKYESIRTDLEQMGVTLLNVNIDKDQTKWQNALAANQINGVHVRGVDLDRLRDQYKLYSIPVYEIVNKRGQLVYLSDIPGRDILNDFKKWLGE